jgi:hypothetical protein
MVRLTSYMKPRMQKTFSIFILGLLVAAGAGCFKKSVEPVGGDAGNEAEQTDTQDIVGQYDGWKKVRIEELGFELYLPEDDASADLSLGPNPKDPDAIWRDSIGSALLGGGRGNILRFCVIVKKTDDTLQQFNEKNGLEFGMHPEEYLINGLPAISLKNPPRVANWGPVPYEQIVALKTKDYIYYLNFQSNLETLSTSETEDVYPSKMEKVDAAVVDKEWERILRSFQTFEPTPYIRSVTAVDTSDWKTLSDESLGFEMKIPPEWDGRTKGGIAEGIYNVVDERHPFWWELVGYGFFSSPGTNLDLKIKKADVSLQEFNDNIGKIFGLNPKEVVVNGFPALIYSRPIYCGKSFNDPYNCQAWDIVLIKNGELFYYLDFHLSSSSLDEATKLYDEWNVVLESLTLFPPKP